MGSLPSRRSALLLACLALALSTSATHAATHQPAVARKLLDGVQLQKFDSLISLKRPDGSDITPASLYNSLRNTFNGYFTQESADNAPAESPAGAAERPQEGRVLTQEPEQDESGFDLEIFMLSSRPDNRRLQQTQAAAAKKTAAPASPVKQATSAPQVVDMTGSAVQQFMLSSRTPSDRAKIEGPLDTSNAPVFDGSGKLVSGGRKLSQISSGQRVTLDPRPQERYTVPPSVPGRVSIDASGRAAGSGASGSVSFDAFGRPMTEPLSGGRRLLENDTATAPAVAEAAAAAAPPQGTPVVVDLSNSQLQKTLLAPSNADGRAKIEGPGQVSNNAPTLDGSGQQVPPSGRKLSQAAPAAKKTATPAQQAAASQFLSSRSTVVDMTNSQLQKTLLAPPNANGQAKIEGPADTGSAPVFDGTGRLVSGGRKLSQTQAAAAKKTAAPASPGKQAATTAPQVVDMTGSAVQKFMLSSRTPSDRAKIEGPLDTSNAPVFDGSGKLVSGGRH